MASHLVLLAYFSLWARHGVCFTVEEARLPLLTDSQFVLEWH